MCVPCVDPTPAWQAFDAGRMYMAHVHVTPVNHHFMLMCSMDKLFDLMVMGAKYQLLCCTKSDDILQVGGSCSCRWLQPQLLRQRTCLMAQTPVAASLQYTSAAAR